MEISDISYELLKKASEGDLRDFEVIYKAASGFVYNVALRVTGHREDAEEATQEVFLKIFDGLKSFKFRSSFKTWIYRITVNAALNIRKKTQNRSGRMVEYDENVADGSLTHDNPVERNVDIKSSKEIVDKLLGILSSDYRACIVLREMQGLSYEEIAEALNININTVRTRLKRAREMLMKGVMANELQ
jgi:RNA polymerase sigma-70 factor, ECF subfamily